MTIDIDPIGLLKLVAAVVIAGCAVAACAESRSSFSATGCCGGMHLADQGADQAAR